MNNWLGLLNGDPLSWLLEDNAPVVKHVALRLLMDRPEEDSEVRHARNTAMETGPIAAILGAQNPEGYWVKPGPGYSPKYTGTAWQLVFLDQMGADGTDQRIQAACEHILSWTQAASGGFGASSAADIGPPPPSRVIHCLHGNLLRALIGFGWLEDEQVQRAVDWQSRSITGEGFGRYYQSGTSGPGFCCAANERLPCAWGAVKAMLALGRIPAERRAPHVKRAIQQGVDFLLRRDPAVADYPAVGGNSKPSRSWFRMGFPLGYVTDVLQNLEALCQAGLGGDPRLQPAVRWLLSKQDQIGCWRNENAYNFYLEPSSRFPSKLLEEENQDAQG